MITILKIANIEKFESLFKHELNHDQKYLPISKKLVDLLDDINPTMTWIEQNIEFREKIALDISLQIHKNYVRQINELNQELVALTEEHKAHIDQFQKDKIADLQKINKEQKMIVNTFEELKDNLKDDFEDKLKKYEQQLKRELSQFEKQKQEARKKYQEHSKDIEDEKKETILNLEKRYAAIINDVNANIDLYEIDYQKELEENETDSKLQKEDNDKIYLNIKNNYHQLTSQFNIAINKLKKAHDKAKNKLETVHKERIAPVHERLDSLNNEYQDTVDKAKKLYQQNLIKLDDKFNEQKAAYEDKKARIIHKSNETITLLNSKLSAYRESITYDKLNQSRTYREQIKQSETEKEKDKLNHELTNVLKSLDNELNRQILRTQKDITVKQKELQQRLYQHDIEHLKEMNDWRLQRNLLSYEYKQDLAKIDLNFNHNLSLSKKHLSLLEDQYRYQLHVLNTTLKKDLLPLETQLAIQSLVQERELNLLNNDQHLSTYLSRFNIAKITHDHQVKVETEALRELKAKLDFESESQVMQITTQLELEKMKSKRDFNHNEQDIRAEIAKSIFNKNKQHIHKQYLLDLEELKHKENLNQIDRKYQIEKVKLDQQQKHHTEEFTLLEKKCYHQAEMSHQKAIRLMKLYLNELNDHQKQSENLFYIIRMFYKKHQQLKDLIKELYLLPSHPEVFKRILKHILDLESTFQEGIKNSILSFKAMDFKYYQKKIDDQIEYKYMLKHEDSMNLFEQELTKIKTQEADIKKEIENLEQQFFQNQQNLERQTQFLNQLQKISDSIQTGAIESKHKHQDLKENQKLIANHQKEIKTLKHKQQLIEKAIDRKHQSIVPYEKQVFHIHENMKKEQEVLKKHQEKESNFYFLYQNKNQQIYEALLNDFLSFNSAHIAYIKNLDETVYVTDSLLFQEEKKLLKSEQLFEQDMIHHQQRLLNHMLDFYQQNDDKQDEIVKDFNKAQDHLLDELKTNKKAILKQIKQLSKQNDTRKDNEIKHQEIAYKQEIIKQEHQQEKALNAIQQNIKSLEDKLEQHLNYMKQELKSINDNQTQIANQNYQEYQKQNNTLNLNHQRHMTKYLQQLEQEEKTYQNFVQSTHNKNQTLLSRYEQNKQKQLDTHKQKNDHFDQDLLKSSQNNDKQHKVYDQEVAHMQENRAHEIKNMNEHIKKYQLKATKAQNRIFRQEQRNLKKNFHFKLKSLHLK